MTASQDIDTTMAFENEADSVCCFPKRSATLARRSNDSPYAESLPEQDKVGTCDTAHDSVHGLHLYH